MTTRWFGQRVQRNDALLTGNGMFVDDVNPPGALHAAVLRSPIAHGRIVSINVSFAAALDGVHAVWTAETWALSPGHRQWLFPTTH